MNPRKQIVDQEGLSAAVTHVLSTTAIRFEDEPDRQQIDCRDQGLERIRVQNNPNNKKQATQKIQ